MVFVAPDAVKISKHSIALDWEPVIANIYIYIYIMQGIRNTSLPDTIAPRTIASSLARLGWLLKVLMEMSDKVVTVTCQLLVYDCQIGQYLHLLNEL